MGVWTDSLSVDVPKFLTMQPLPEWASRYVGIPYADYGRDRDGCDCWGLVRLIWSEQCNLVLPEHALDPKAGGDIEKRIAANLEPWNIVLDGDERAFDAAVMTGCYGAGPAMRRAKMHVGIVVSPGVLIHTTSNTGSAVLARYRDRMTSHSIVGFYRHRTLDA